MPKVERIEVPVKPEVKYVITLTEEEAFQLRAYLTNKAFTSLTHSIFCALPCLRS